MRLWINQELLIDKWWSFAGDSYGDISLTAGRLNDVRIEYRDRYVWPRYPNARVAATIAWLGLSACRLSPCSCVAVHVRGCALVVLRVFARSLAYCTVLFPSTDRQHWQRHVLIVVDPADWRTEACGTPK